MSEYNFNPNHPRFHPHNLSVVSPSENSTTAPIPAHIGHIEHTAPPQHQYNHQSHQFPPHSFSNPNPIPPEQLAQQLSLSPRRHEDVTLLDTLLSAPDDHHDDNQQINNIKQKKSKSHQPRMYKRRELETTKQKKSKSKPHKHESVAKLVSSHTEMTSPSESNHDTQSHKYHPLKLVKTPEPQSIIDPILQSGSGQPRYINHLSNHSRIRGDSINNSSKELRAVSYEHQKNTSNTTESRITINSDPRGDVYVNYRDENSYTNNGNYDNLRDKDTKSININDHYRHNDSIQFDSVSPRNSRRNSPKHCLSQSGPQTHQIGNYRGNSHSPGRGNNNRSYQSPRDRNRKNGRPFSAKYTKFDFERIVPNKYGHRGQRNLKQPRREHQHQHSTTKSKSGTYSEVEGKEFSSQNRTIRPFYPSKNNGNGAMEKPKLGKHNAYSSPLYNINGSEYLIHPKHMNQGYKNVSPRKNANNYHSQAKTMDNLMSNVSNVDLEEILSINNHAYDMDDDNMHYVQSIEKSATDTVIVHNNNKENINNNNNMHNMESQNEIHEGSPFHHGKSPSFSILDRNQGTFGGINHVTSMDDMDPLILSPINKRRTHLKKQRSQSVVELFSNEPSHLGDIHDINHTPIQIKQSASDDLDVTSDDMNDIVHDPDYKNINKRNKTKKQRRKSIDHNNQTPNETPTYKIVLKTEDSNYLEYKTPKSKDNNNNLNKPRFSQSASTATTTTATISQTPSYLREDRKWDVSMKYQSQTGTHSVESDNSGSSSTGEWMLHGMINVNGNVEEPQERGFFNDENGEFPNIESVPNRSKTHLNNTNKKPQVSPRLSPHDIASKHELQQRIILKKSKHHRKHHQNHNLLTSPTATTATSVTDTVTNESDDAFIYNQ